MLQTTPWARPSVGALFLSLGLSLGVPVVLADAATAAPQASQMQDLPANHWAFQAIRDLMEKYGVMEGFPDNTFQGVKTVSRYELAAALTRVMQRMDALAAVRASAVPAPAPTPGPATAPPVKTDTIAADRLMVDKLKGEFKKELDVLSARLDKDELSLKDVQDKLAKLVTVAGRVSTVYADETLDTGKDRTLPYISSTLNVSFRGKVSDSTTFDTTIAGTVKAAGSGDVPAVMAGALGKTPTSDQVAVKGARFTTKIGATTINVGRFSLGAADFGPGSDLNWRTGDFDVGVGVVSQDASSLRVGGDVGMSLGTELGGVKILGGLNSNIIAGQVNWGIGPVMLKAGYETDHKAITQNLIFPVNAPVKTTDNACLVLDFGGDSPWGATAQVNATNLALTAYGLGVRAAVANIDTNLIAMINSDPSKTVTVASIGGVVGTPAYPLPWGLRVPALLFALTDNYTIDAPARADQKPTTGAGGQALGKLAGVSVKVDLENPFIPGLVAEYNVQSKLIEDIFLPNSADPITSESVFFKSVVKF